MQAGLTAAIGQAKAAIKAQRSDLPVGVSIAMGDDRASVTTRRSATASEPRCTTTGSAVAAEDDFVGVQNYERRWYDANGEVEHELRRAEERHGLHRRPSLSGRRRPLCLRAGRRSGPRDRARHLTPLTTDLRADVHRAVARSACSTRSTTACQCSAISTGRCSTTSNGSSGSTSARAVSRRPYDVRTHTASRAPTCTSASSAPKPSRVWPGQWASWVGPVRDRHRTSGRATGVLAPPRVRAAASAARRSCDSAPAGWSRCSSTGRRWATNCCRATCSTTGGCRCARSRSATASSGRQRDRRSCWPMAGSAARQARCGPPTSSGTRRRCGSSSSSTASSW